MKKTFLFFVTHLFAALAGFVVGIYSLPILTAPDSPSASEVALHASQARFTGQFRRDLKGSDFLHWGDGIVSVSDENISLAGKIAPGPNYKLYLSPEFIETEQAFIGLKDMMVQVGDVMTFENFVVEVPQSINVSSYNTVIVWCESFSEFITAAQYR